MVFLTSVIGSIFIDAEIAQLVEQRIRNAWVEGSSPFFGLKIWEGCLQRTSFGGCLLAAFCRCIRVGYLMFDFIRRLNIWRHLGGINI